MVSTADDELMTGVRNGNVRLLGALFERHQAPLYHFFLRQGTGPQLSEDLVQEVFFRILRFRETFREGSSFTTWMYRIARNARVDALRKRKPEEAIDEGPGSPVDPRRTPVESLESAQQEQLLRRALASLPEDRREVLILSRYQNLKYDQIADLLECDTGAVKVRVHRAIRELRDIYASLSQPSGRLRPGRLGAVG